jgi:hypothetical protein
MPVPPSQFKAVKTFADLLINELASLKDAIHKHTAATNHAQETNEQKWSEVPRIIASNVLGTENDRATANAQYQQTYRQHERLIGAQDRTVFWARLAFFAAAGYGAVAFWQACLTKQALKDNGSALTQTLGEMDAQTLAANRLATATETANTNVLEADRPWFGAVLAAQDAIEAGKSPSITVVFLNSGKRPARVLISQVASNWFTVFPKNPPYPLPPSSIRSSDIVVPNSAVITKLNITQKPLDQAAVDAANAGRPKKFFIYADMEYLDLRTQTKHFTHSCWEYIGNDPVLAKGFYNSGDYNDAN